MTIFRAMVILPSESGLPEDVTTNTFHFHQAVDGVGDPADLIFPIVKFYTAGTDPLQEWMSNYINGPAIIKIYDLSDSIPRVPVVTEPFTITPDATVSGLMEEVALVLSFQATPASGVNQARQRGRIYLGPLSLRAIEGAGVGDSSWPMPPRPDSDLITAAVAAMETLRADTNTLAMPWAVYSPTSSAANTISNGWVDNAFDTQRRRGLRPTDRTLWP